MLEFFIQGVTYLLKNESYMYSPDRREWSLIVTYHSQSNCPMQWETAKAHILKLKHENGIKMGKNMLRQTLILKIYHLESIVSVLNLVTLPPLSNLINLLIKYEQYKCKKSESVLYSFQSFSESAFLPIPDAFSHKKMWKEFRLEIIHIHVWKTRLNS